MYHSKLKKMKEINKHRLTQVYLTAQFTELFKASHHSSSDHQGAAYRRSPLLGSSDRLMGVDNVQQVELGSYSKTFHLDMAYLKNIKMYGR